jgi:hypothetical protein
VKHPRVAGLVAGAVIEKVLHLRLRLSLGFERAGGAVVLGG